MTITEDRVQTGAAWLDLTYPGWYRSIDLSILDVAKCDVCVLGQIYTGCIPEGERGQILAQAMLDKPRYWSPFGYNVLSELHQLTLPELEAMGFVLITPDNCECENLCTCIPAYPELTDAWTTLIIQRRLDEHPDVRLEYSTLKAIEPEKVTA